MTLSSVVRQGSRLALWKAIPTMESGLVTRWPATVTRPELVGHSPETTFIRVDLPQPDGPTTATKSPLSTESVALWSASVPFASPP